MVRSTVFSSVCVLVLGGMLAYGAPAAAQSGSQSLGSVSVTRRVLANGQALAPGTYTLRLSTDSLSPVVGQTPAESRWVEFVQGGQVKGREVATVLTTAEAKTVMKEARPASGTSRTEVLKGNDYLRVWVNRGGTQYVVYLATPRT
jgi:hypothetical protein